ncbi:MAG: membrane protease YdiL (CAAX protease family) [Saprospiraceae bacterium]
MSNIDHQNEVQYPCKQCGSALSKTAKFCVVCGSKVTLVLDSSKKDIWKFLLSFFVVLLYIVIAPNLGESSYGQVLIVDVAFFSLIILISRFFKKELLPFVKAPSFKLKTLFKYLGIQALLTTCVFVFSDLLTDLFSLEAYSYVGIYHGSSAPLMLSLLSIAVFPAITEEIAFRGIFFGQLNKLTSSQSTIMITGLVFAFVHFSVLSFLWLIPIGLFYGWIRDKEKTIWYGVLLHFLHNATVVLFEFYQL